MASSGISCPFVVSFASGVEDIAMLAVEEVRSKEPCADDLKCRAAMWTLLGQLHVQVARWAEVRRCNRSQRHVLLRAWLLGDRIIRLMLELIQNHAHFLPSIRTHFFFDFGEVELGAHHSSKQTAAGSHCSRPLLQSPPRLTLTGAPETSPLIQEQRAALSPPRQPEATM